MAGEALISIIIPAYNAEATLATAIKSATDQTYQNLEIIIVDDGSTDNTVAIAHAEAQRDSRIQTVFHERNKGRLKARRTGILAATGERVLFLDADDELDSRACEVCLSADNRNFDIVHFNFEIRYQRPVSAQKVTFNEQFVTPPDEKAYGEEVTHVIFRDRKGPWSLCGKLMRAEHLKLAVMDIPESSMTQAEDVCLFFLVSHYAQSYRGLPEYRGYIYNIDIGGSDAAWETMNLEQFRYTCDYRDAMENIHAFIEQHGLWGSLKADYERIYTEHLNAVTGRLLTQVEPADMPASFDYFISRWPAVDIAGTIAEQSWENCASVLDSFATSQTFQTTSRAVRTIAISNYGMSIGGAERVARDLMAIWIKQGYRVIFFSDTPAQEGEYSLPSEVTRIVLPHYTAVDAHSYHTRAKLLYDALKRYNVDVLIYQQWSWYCIGWDLLTCKLADVPLIAFTQSSFSQLLKDPSQNSLQIPLIYRHLAGIVSLSGTDQLFWRQFNANAWKVLNPLTLQPIKEGRSSLNNNEIVWIGRLDQADKRPIDALYILKKLIDAGVATHLSLVGPESENCRFQDLQNIAEELGISEYVSILGATDHPEHYLRQAALYLLTSREEGYSLTLAEAKACGVPCVMYQMPYLELAHNSRGILSVDESSYLAPSEAEALERRTAAAARVIQKVLLDESLKKKLSEEGFAHMQEIASYDLAHAWDEILHSVEQTGKNATLANKPLADAPRENIELMWDMVISSNRFAAETLQQARIKRDIHYGETLELRSQIEGMKASTTWHLGSIFTKPLHALKERFKHSASS